MTMSNSSSGSIYLYAPSAPVNVLLSIESSLEPAGKYSSAYYTS